MIKDEYQTKGYHMEQSISGYWRLFKDDEIVHDDSACEDVYNEETASYLFNEIIKEID